MASPNPADRFKAAAALANCAHRQILNVAAAKLQPEMAATMYADINVYCDGFTADMLQRRIAILEELAKARHPGAAVAYSLLTPDGVLLSEARNDVNYASWYAKAKGYLKDAAATGDFRAIELLSSMLRLDLKEPYEALVYRVAHMDAYLRHFQPDGPASPERVERERKAKLERELSLFTTHLTQAEIAKAIEAGLAIAAKVKPQPGS